MSFLQLRENYHRAICRDLLGLRNGILTNADDRSRTSVEIATHLLAQLEYPHSGNPSPNEKVATVFSELTLDFLAASFDLIKSFLPGNWVFSTSERKFGTLVGREDDPIFAWQRATEALDKTLTATVDDGSVIKPDIIIAKVPINDAELNSRFPLLPESSRVATLTPFLRTNTTNLTLHAIVSCKWTIRSDRAQNVRTEALNLIRLRKGSTPHIVAVIAEPMPTRIASLALGTGDIDCVYHMALPELQAATKDSGNADQEEMLNTLVTGRRLRDIADLPFDLVN